MPPVCQAGAPALTTCGRRVSVPWVAPAPEGASRKDPSAMSDITAPRGFLTQSLAAPEHRTKSALAIEALRSAILRGDVSPDAPLTVTSVARRLGMSPTPVREAIRTLQAEGLLRHEPHHSAAVTRYTAKDIHDLYEMRAELESRATLLATPRLTPPVIERLEQLNDTMRVAAERSDFDQMNRLNGEWHLLIYSAADNRILLDLVQYLWRKFMWDVNWVLPGRAGRSIEEHAAVLQALRSGDAEGAASRMRAHLQFGEEYAAAYVERHGAGGNAGGNAGERAGEPKPQVGQSSRRSPEQSGEREEESE